MHCGSIASGFENGRSGDAEECSGAKPAKLCLQIRPPGGNLMRLPMLVVMLAALGSPSCAHIDPHPMDMTQAIRNAETSEDYMALARHYEAVGEQMLVKARASARELEEYEMHPYYGVRTQELKAHCR